MNALNIALNDFKIMLKNKFTFALLLLMPVFMIFLMGNALKSVFNVNKGIEKFQMLYVNEDNGYIGLAFDGFMKDGADKFIEAVGTNAENIESKVLSGKYNGAIIVPAGLSDKVSRGEVAYINVISSGKDDLRDSIVSSIVDSFTRFTGVQLGIQKGYSEYQNTKNPIEVSQKLLEIHELYGGDYVVSKDVEVSPLKKLTSFQYFTLSMLLFFMLSAGMGVGGGIVGDRVNKIFGRINSYPVSDREYLIGKVAGNLMLCLLQTLFIILFTTFVFKVDWGTNFLGIGIVITLMMLISSSIGLLFSSFVNSEKTLNSTMIIVIWLITFISGGFTPVPALEPIARFTFYRWGLDSLANFMAGGGFMDTVNNLILLLVTVIVLWTAGLYLYRRRVSHE